MTISQEQIEELLGVFPNVKQASEGGTTYFLLPKLNMPLHCTPDQVDALLCPVLRDGYQSRLFLSEKVNGNSSRNWTVTGNVRILDRNWYAISWQTRPGLRLMQMLLAHLDAFKP